MSAINTEMKAALMTVYKEIAGKGIAHMAQCDVYQEAIDLVPDGAWGSPNQHKLDKAALCDKALRRQFDIPAILAANGGLWPEIAYDAPMLAADGGRTTPALCLVEDQIAIVQRSGDNKDAVVLAHQVTEDFHNPVISYRVEHNHCSFPEAMRGMGLEKPE